MIDRGIASMIDPKKESTRIEERSERDDDIIDVRWSAFRHNALVHIGRKLGSDLVTASKSHDVDKRR